MIGKIGIITQARTTSTRLPRKILLQAAGKTVLEHHVKRLGWSNLPIIIATTVNDTDSVIAELADALQIPSFRGSEHDVLGRFYECAVRFDLNTIVRVTSDCPLIDGHLISDAIKDYIKWDNQDIYYSNAIQRTFPRGLDFEIFSMKLLQEAFLKAKSPQEREHVTPYINQNKGGNVNVKHFLFDADESDLRWTLDTLEDWQLIETLLNDGAEYLRFKDLLSKVRSTPSLTKINNNIRQKLN